MTPKLPHANCDSCPARGGKMLPPRAALRPGVVRLAIVGERPAGEDLSRGEVFSSVGARLLFRNLAEVGVSPTSCHLTNAVACSCPPKAIDEARKCCEPRLITELEAAGVDVIVTLGADATRSVVGRKTPIAKWRGSVWRQERPAASGKMHRYVLPLLHPFEVRKSPKWAPVMCGDIERVGRVVAQLAAGEPWRPPEEQDGRRFIVPQSLPALHEALALLRPGWVACDIETVGLGATSTLLVCVGISDGMTTVVVPWSKTANGLESFWGADEPAVVAALNRLFADRVVVGHNFAAFDSVVLGRYGIVTPRIDDTILMTHAIDGHMPKRLGHVVTANGIDVPPWKELESRKKSIEELWTYCGRDNLYTALLYEVLRQRLAAAV